SEEYGIEDILIGVALLLAGLLLITARYGLLIDIRNTTYTVYSLWLGMKFGQAEKFGRIEKLYINRIKETYSVSKFAGARTDVSSHTFKAFMLLDTGEKVHVDTHKSMEKLTEKVRQYEQVLAPILDESRH
ncbi:MAG: hypothetical protein WBA74_06890, partial [Cyclobacteriaceae bacterium]